MLRFYVEITDEEHDNDDGYNTINVGISAHYSDSETSLALFKYQSEGVSISVETTIEA